jgi:hypothetical protein
MFGFLKQIYLFGRSVLTLLWGLVLLLRKRKLRVAAFAAVLLVAGAALYEFLYPALPAPILVFDTMYLKQGWTDEQRQKYYQTSQGTLIVPYSWFFALEVMPSSPFMAREGPATSRWWSLSIDDKEMMASKENLSKYRLIPDVRPQFNPDLLPIGITKEVVPDELVEQLGAGHKEWISYTCAACHTAQLNYKGLGIRVDGGTSLWNFTQFNTALANALLATDAIPSKFDRFATRVLEREGKRVNEENRTKLKNELRAFLESPPIKSGIVAIFKRSYPVKEGFGRMDALGRGANGQFAQIDPRNVLTANSPVSIPPVWFTHQYDWVQSVAAIRQPLGRNVTESWGVNVAVDLTTSNPEKRYASTHPLMNLYWMEALVAVLDQPAWPQEILGAIDDEAARRGKELYEERMFANALAPSEEELWPNPNRARTGLCARCHAPVKEAEPNIYGKTYYQLPMVKLDVLGTDPGDATSFADRQVYTGPLKDVLFDGQEQVGVGVALQKTTTQIMNRLFKEARVPPDQQPLISGFRANDFRAPLAYPARPLGGYWTTGPFLHNGSIPSMYQLLSPQKERDSSFWTGSAEFDPVRLGYSTESMRGGFNFKTRYNWAEVAWNAVAGVFTSGEFAVTRKIPGNSNEGHEFRNAPKGTPGVIGPYLTPSERMDIIEYLKVLRDVPPLTGEERAERIKALEESTRQYDAHPTK